MIEKTKILAVDDKAENLLTLKASISSSKIEVLTALSGKEALALVLEHDFALILMDVQMPEINGFETAALLRGTEQTRYIPIIFITAFLADEKNVFKGYDSGAVDYISKPFNLKILNAKVNIFVELAIQKKVIQKQMDDINNKNLQLKKQIEEIRNLKALIPICSSCKSIRDDNGYWESVEIYISKQTGSQFSHGICPDCMKKLYPDIAAKLEQKKNEKK